MIGDKKNRQAIKFVEQLVKLDEIEVIGLAKLMGVELLKKETCEPRLFEYILSEMIDKYIGYNREKRRKIDFVLKAATKTKN